MKIGYVISFLVGGAIGTGLTYYFSHKHFESRRDKEVSALKEFYEKKETKKSEETKCHTITESETDSYESDSITEVDDNDTSDEAQIIRDAARFLEEANIAADETAEKRKRNSKKAPKKKPYLITPEAYNGDDDTQYRDDYKHLTLDYYEGDDIVCESTTNEIFNNTGRWLGYVWKNHFGDEDLGYDNMSVFIRNDETKVDYEIVRDSGYYSEAVLGIYPDDKEEDEE